jgi:hypothetical protein
MTDDMLTKGERRSSLDELADSEWTDQMLTSRASMRGSATIPLPVVVVHRATGSW